MAVIVIDVGCAKHGSDESIPALVEEYDPQVVLGLDPAVGEERMWWCGDSYVVEEPVAAWTYDGHIGFKVASLGGHVHEGGASTRCHDLARVVREHAFTGHQVVLKLDCESAEYVLVPYLVEQGVDELLFELRVEWHCECGYGIWNGVHPDVGCERDFQAWLKRRDAIVETLRCAYSEWVR